MTRVLTIGMGPLLETGVRKIGGQCLRTWHFVKPLVARGHDVRLVALPIPDREASSSGSAPAEERLYRGFPYVAIGTNEQRAVLSVIKKVLEGFDAECIAGINSYPAYMASLLGTEKPLWADLNGYAMAEGQTKAYVYGDDAVLGHFWEMERVAVRRADKFSTVSTPQLHALIGELAAVGRLNRFTFNYPFGHVVPNAVNEFFLQEGEEKRESERLLRGRRLPEDSFIVLWSGGFNTWTDVETLIEGLMGAMRRDERIYFVSTGGMVDGHDEKTYARFEEAVQGSGLAERFLLLGWVEAEFLPRYYLESDIGINVDSRNYETLFGARNRLVNMMAMGLPVVTTRGTEISYVIESENVGLTFGIGDAKALETFLVRYSRAREVLRRIGERARKYALEHFSYDATTRSFQEWVDEPRLAPDNAEKLARLPGGKGFLDVALNDVERLQVFLNGGELEGLRRAKEELERLRRKGLYKLYRALKGLFG
jgi:glycosyltransferase involved in cell wall biosynthesis